MRNVFRNKICLSLTIFTSFCSPYALADSNLEHKSYFPFSPPSTDRFYVIAGLENTTINIESHRLPMTFGNWVPSFPQTAPPQSQIPAELSPPFKPNNTATIFSLGLGYNLQGTPFLPRLFDHESVEVAYSQFNRGTKNVATYTGATGVDAGAEHGVIWAINDSTSPIYDGGALRIQNSYIHASLAYKQAAVFLKGDMLNLPGDLKSTARIGAVITNFNQRYNYTINSTTQGTTHDPKFTMGNDTLYAQYGGLAVGDKLSLKIAPAFSIFVDGSFELFYVNAGLVANETPDTLANGVYSSYRNNIRVSDYDSSMSYRAQVAAGISFYPNIYGPNSPKLTLSAGVDQWGYVPQEITITGPNSFLPHIQRSSMRNYFSALSVSIPIV
jgi:hypothetical protein